jgi:hypothetical protein
MMMEDYPSNSARATRPDLKQPETEPKKIDKVVSGEVVRRKKPLNKRFREIFVGQDAKTAWGFVLFDVLIPAAKDTMADAVSQGVERMLFGDARSNPRRSGGYRPPYSVTPTQSTYTRYSTGSSYAKRDERVLSRRARATHNFDEIILPTRVEAEEVLENLYNILSRYEQATVSDLYDLLGVTGNYTDEKWGWTELTGSGIDRVREGYLLDIPKPEPLR